VTIEEIMEVCSIGIMMGGGPVLTHMAEVERALNEFYLDEDGEPV
jgi:alkylhydroperoxidase/carboxymuconolactone decarboxylase family protein YurZ